MLDKTSFILYILVMMKVTKIQQKVLEILSNKIDDFYLAGGTALSLYYFHHRESEDLDFFARKFSKSRIIKIVELLSGELDKKIELVSELDKKGMVKVLVYLMHIDKRNVLKIDFVEDYLNFINQPKSINGVNVLSLDDIYLRKIYAATGIYWERDLTGRKISKGGRQEAKDLYDLYCLSHIYMGLADFAFKNCNQLVCESIIRWFRTYSRMDMKIGLTELGIKKSVDFNEIERHFKKEIEKIIEKEVEDL